MGKKYIIELNPDCVEGEYLRIPARIAGEQQWLMTKAELTPCTELDLEQIRREAYAEGDKEGMQLSIDDAKLKEEYQQGINDAWDVARKIIRMPEGDLLNLFDVYSSVCTSAQAILKYEASEAIAKIKEYEDSKLEIMVGDEVKTEDGMKMVIATIINKDFAGLGEDGLFMLGELDGTITRTGRHFPEIATVLKKMRGEQE